MLRLFLFCLVTITSLPAFAIYKCTMHGATTYSDTPCPNAKLLDVATDSAIATDASDAHRQLAREKKELKILEDARHRQEARDDKERQRLARKTAVKDKRCASLALRKKWSEEDAAAASFKTRDKAKLRAQRMGEKYALECGT